MLESCKISKDKLRVSITDALKIYSTLDIYEALCAGTSLDPGETSVNKIHKIPAHWSIHSVRWGR